MIQDLFELQNPWRFRDEYLFREHPRAILSELIANIENDKILGLIGARQVGKSSLLFLLIKELFRWGIPKTRIFYFNLDNIALHSLFEDIKSLLNFIDLSSGRAFIFIDEIQRLPSPGLALKALHDLKLDLKVFYSGSSQIELQSKMKEHLVGRVRQFEIRRLSFEEYCEFQSPITKTEAFFNYLTYGSYPEVALARSAQEKELLLRDIHLTYVQKDLVEWLKIDDIAGFNQLLGLLASQTGELLSIEMLANTLNQTREMIKQFLSILEATFIIKRITPFYKNYKKEISKTPKVYFLDLGLRNYLLNNFMDISLRSDKGHLFENFYFLQELSSDPYNQDTIHFWRTTNQTEIDFIINRRDRIEAIETKWNRSQLPKSFHTLQRYYPDITSRVVTRHLYLD